MLSVFIIFTTWVRRLEFPLQIWSRTSLYPPCSVLCRETSVFTFQPHAGNGRDYICGNELSFQEVIMDLGLRARQIQHGESAGDETWEPRYRLCVYTVDLCTYNKDVTHTHKHTVLGWTSVQMRERWWILLGCLVGGGYPTTRFLQSSKFLSGWK